ncbi:hypothetical protein TanjilG_27150 [Lupinus angustifolius]|uniref:Pentatricopeptide repeat-containing protein n=1 Tax=Lupinus angustifolius TaxID=3871 RepID=A0A4P1QW12_LUPAN|nr:hypothetical protein TanjilG_27150 [Lupinus angustifolius]
MITTGFIKNTAITTKLVLTFISSPYEPLVEFARYVFFKHHTHGGFVKHRQGDPFLWNAVIRSYSHGSDPKGSLFILCLMLENGVCLDKYSFSLVLKACSHVGLLKEGMQVHGLLCKTNIGSDVFLQNCLIGLFIRCGCIELAQQLFERMPDRDTVSFNSMIDGYVKYGLVERAHELFDAMSSEEKNLITWNSMIGGYVRSKDGMDIAWSLFFKMPERDLVSWNTMIDGCAKHGKMEDAQALFDEMPERDSVSWVAMIDGYAKSGDIVAGRSLFDEMPKRDVISCNSMMAGYVHNCYSVEALQLFHDMRRAMNLLPDDTTLLIVLTAISQLGHIEVGVAIHCYIMDNGYCLSEPIAQQLIQLNSCSPSSYVLLSNIYASLGMWDNVKRVRTKMKGKKLKKIPGCSWIELGGIVHQFSVQDRTHPQVTEIYSLLSSL